jgi:glycosyltransferase involved in cell wall biosynthesis
MTGRRIYFVNRFFLPDISATSQLLGELSIDLAKCLDVHIVTSRLLYGGTGRVLSTTESCNGVMVHRVWTSAFGRHSRFRVLDYITFYLSSFLFLLVNLRKTNVVVSKTDPPVVSVVAMIAARVRGAVHICWIQDLFPEIAERADLPLPKVLFGMIRQVRNWSLRQSWKSICIGLKMQEYLASQHVPRSCLEVIPNWFDGTLLKPMPRELNPLRRAWGLEGRFIVGYSGNLGRVHALDSVVEAARLLANRQDIVFLMIGNGARRASLERAAAVAGLENVIFREYVPREELAHSLTLPDVHLVSLKPEYEGLVVPSKVYGAMAAGVPILNIGAADGEVAELLRKGRCCGVTVACGDASDLASKVKKLADDPELTQSWGAAARAEFDQQFDRARAVRSWVQILELAP